MVPIGTLELQNLSTQLVLKSGKTLGKNQKPYQMGGSQKEEVRCHHKQQLLLQLEVGPGSNECCLGWCRFRTKMQRNRAGFIPQWKIRLKTILSLEHTIQCTKFGFLLQCFTASILAWKIYENTFNSGPHEAILTHQNNTPPKTNNTC